MELSRQAKLLIFCFQNLQELAEEDIIEFDTTEERIVSHKVTSQYDQIMAEGFKPKYLEIYLTILSLPEICLDHKMPIVGVLMKIVDVGFDNFIEEYRKFQRDKDDRVSEDEFDSGD